MDRQWNKVLSIIKDQISLGNFRQWFANTQIDPSSTDPVIVRVPNAFIQEQLTKRYSPIVEAAVQTVFGGNRGVEFKVDTSLAVKKKDEETEHEDESLELNFVPGHIQQNNSGLNPTYTMDNFVVGLSNNLAYAAAQAVIQNPNTTYNPLFIWGGTGVGKTHLMHAVGNALWQKNPTIKVIYCSSEKFTNDFVESIQTKKTSEFRARYRSCNLFLIDDIQFIAGRDSTQEEFFHTFNELHSKNTQVILTSDRPPYELQKLEPRLSSRFQAGLIVDVQAPDFDTRVAILRTKCKERGDFVPEECLTLIAEHTQTNARELEGKLIQIIQTAKLQNLTIDIDYVRNQVGAGRGGANNPPADSKKVITSVNQYFNIKMADLTGPRRNKELVLPRQLAMYLLHVDCKIPFEKIGDMLGGRDHTTIMHGVDKMREVINRDREIQRMLIEIKQAVAA